MEPSSLILPWAVCVTLCLLQMSNAEKQAAYDEDKITSLPGVSQLPDFAMYSGYLAVTEEKQLHYWLNMCEQPRCPLLVWFNGGPGCSSLDGLLNEHGPFKINLVTGELEENAYSWNKLAHTLYIEAPAGVGFSYDTSHEPASDDTFAADAHKALLNFREKFPMFMDADIFIAGESYAGVYVPTLAKVILDNGSTLKDQIKGFAIGNGVLSTTGNEESLVYYAYYHGLFGISLWQDLMKHCCTDSSPSSCSFDQFRNEECMRRVIKVYQLVFNNGLNAYNLYQSCATPTQKKLMEYIEKAMEQIPVKVITSDQPLKIVPPCANVTFITNYFNDPQVQESIHVKPGHWQICSDAVHADYQRIYYDVTEFVQRITTEMDARILLYFGDVDMACNHIGGEWFADNLGLEVTEPRRIWMSPADDGSDQVAGFVKGYDRLTYITVKGAGHMVPADKPKPAFVMMERFLNQIPF